MGLSQKYLPHYTYDDYYQWDGNWELIYGVPYAMFPHLCLNIRKLMGKY